MTHKTQLFLALAMTAALLLFGLASELGAFRHDGAPYYIRLERTHIQVTGAVQTTITKADISCRGIPRNTKRFYVDTYRDGKPYVRLQVSKEGGTVDALFWSPYLFQNPSGTGVTVNTASRTVTLHDAPFTAPVGDATVHLTGTFHCAAYARR